MCIIDSLLSAIITILHTGSLKSMVA